MPQPYDYSLKAADPTQAFVEGLQLSNGLQQMQQQRAQQQMQQQVITSLLANPNPGADDYARATLIIPGMREHFKQAWDMHNTDQQQALLQQIGQVHAALSAGQPQVASDILRRRAEALKNSNGPADQIQAAQSMADVIDQHPQFARTMTGMQLASIPGGDKVLSNLATLGKEDREKDLHPAAMVTAEAGASKASSEAVIKSVEAGNAQTATVLGNEKTAQEIRASKLKGQIDLLDKQIASANSETERGRLQLERDKLTLEQQKLGQAQGQGAQDAQNLATQAMSTLQQIKQHPGMDGYFTAPGTKWGAIWRVVPGSDRQALEGWIDSLKGQLGYTNLMAAKSASPTGASGFGALSEGELKLLTNLAGNLDPNSSDFPRQLAGVERYLQKAQATAVARPQLPNTGEAFVLRHPVYGNVTEGQVNSLMRQFPGSTREQVLTFLQQTGGK